MPSARDARASARTARPDAPFGAPNPDEVFEILIPEGAATGKIPARDDYLGKCLSLVRGKAKKSGNDMLTFTFTISDGEYSGMDFSLYCTLTPNSLWKLTQTLAAMGIKATPGDLVKFSPRDVVGCGVRMVVQDEPRQDGMGEVSKLMGILPHPKGAGFRDGKGAVVIPGADDEDEEPVAQRGRKATRRPLDEDDDLEEETPRRRSRTVDDEDPEEEEAPAPRRRAAAKDEEWEEPPPAPARRRAAVVEEEEEEPEPPARNGRAQARPAGRRGRI